MRVISRLHVVLLTLLLGGCIEVRPHPPFDAPDMRKTLDSLVAKRSTRAEVIAALGTSLVSNPYWLVDVFRETSTESNLGGVLPVVLPMGNTRYVGYTIISYDTSGNAEAGDAAVVPNAQGSLLLRAADYQLAIHSSGNAELVVSGERFVRELRARRNPSTCTVLVGTKMDAPNGPGQPIACLPDQINVDGGEDQSMTVSTWIDALGGSGAALRLFHPVQLPAGTRTISFSQRNLDGTFGLEIQCSAGEVSVVDLTCNLTKRSWRAPRVTGRASLSQKLESSSVPQYVVLSYFYHGSATPAFDPAKNATGDRRRE